MWGCLILWSYQKDDSATCDKLVDKWVKDHGQNSDKGIKAGAAPVSFNEIEKVDRREIYDLKV